MFKEPEQNKAMEGHMIESEDVPNEGSCRVLCYMEPNCVSINVGPLREGKHKCELNNATAENPFDFQLVNRDRFTYVAVEVSLHARVALQIIQLLNACRSNHDS